MLTDQEVALCKTGQRQSPTAAIVGFPRKVRFQMAVERDFTAERIARIDLLLADAQRMLTVPPDPKGRRDMCARLDATLKELGARVPIV